MLPLARHGSRRMPSAWSSVVKLLGLVVVVVLVSAASVSTIAVAQLRSNIDTVTLPGQGDAPPPSLGEYEGGFDLLLVGSDECVDTGGCPDRTEKLADFTMLLHVAEDGASAVAVSFPRDLLVPIPSCPREDGEGSYDAMSSQQINATLAYGGLPCAVLTVNALTGLQIPFGGIMKFNGVTEISNVIGGVTVCTDGPIDDRYSGLSLPKAGEHLLEGPEVLAFLRTRYGVGNGGDVGRIGSQQALLSSLVRQIKEDGTLQDPAKLFRLATAASRNMTVSDNLADPSTLVSMALVLKDLPLENISFVQYPAEPDPDNPNRLLPLTDEAEDLFERIRSDQPIVLESSTGVGTVADPTAPTPLPTPPPLPSDTTATPTAPATDVLEGVTGQTAADRTCSRAND